MEKEIIKVFIIIIIKMSIIYISINEEIYPFTMDMIKRSITLQDLVQGVSYQDFELTLDNRFEILYRILIKMKYTINQLIEVIDIIDFLYIADLLKKVKSAISRQMIDVSVLKNNYEKYKNIPEIKTYAITYISLKGDDKFWEEYNIALLKTFIGFDVKLVSDENISSVVEHYEKTKFDGYLVVTSPSYLVIFSPLGKKYIDISFEDDGNYVVTWFDLFANNVVDTQLMRYGWVSMRDIGDLSYLQKIVEDKYDVRLIKGDQIRVKPYNDENLKFVMLYNGSNLVFPEFISGKNAFSSLPERTLSFPGKDFIFPQDKIEDVFGINEYGIRYIDNYLINLLKEAPITGTIYNYVYKKIVIDGKSYVFFIFSREDFSEETYFIINYSYDPEPIHSEKFEDDVYYVINYRHLKRFANSF